MGLLVLLQLEPELISSQQRALKAKSQKAIWLSNIFIVQRSFSLNIVVGTMETPPNSINLGSPLSALSVSPSKDQAIVVGRDSMPSLLPLYFFTYVFVF